MSPKSTNTVQELTKINANKEAARQCLLAADKYLKDSEFSLARTELDKALKLDPSNGYIYAFQDRINYFEDQRKKEQAAQASEARIAELNRVAAAVPAPAPEVKPVAPNKPLPKAALQQIPIPDRQAPTQKQIPQPASSPQPPPSVPSAAKPSGVENRAAQTPVDHQGKKAEEARSAAEEQRRREEEARVAEEEQRRRESDTRMAAEVEIRREAEQRAFEEQRQKELQERAALEDMIRKELEARVAEEERKRKDLETRILQERKQKELETLKIEEQKRKELEARFAAEEQRRKELEARLAAEEQRKRDEDLRAAEERRRKETEEQAAEERRKLREMEARAAEEERRRKELEARIAEEERKRKELELKALEEENKRREAELRTREAQKQKEREAREAAELAQKEAEARELEDLRRKESEEQAKREADARALEELKRKEAEERAAEERKKLDEMRRQVEELTAALEQEKHAREEIVKHNLQNAVKQLRTTMEAAWVNGAPKEQVGQAIHELAGSLSIPEDVEQSVQREVKLEMYSRAVKEVIAKRKLLRNSSSTLEWLRKVYQVSVAEYLENESKFLLDLVADQYKGTVLLISKSLGTREDITPRLKSTGYAVVQASTPEQALEKIEKVNPNIVLCDVEFPGGLSGVRFLHVLRANAKFNFIPFILLTEPGEIGAIKASDLKQNEGCLKRPVDYEELNNLMNEKLTYFRDYISSLA